MKKIFLVLAVLISALTASAEVTQLTLDPVFDQSVPANQTQNIVTITGANILSVSAVSSDPSVATVSVNGMNVTTTFGAASANGKKVKVTVTVTGTDNTTEDATYTVFQYANATNTDLIYYGSSASDKHPADFTEIPGDAKTATSTITTEMKNWNDEYIYFFVPKSLSNIVSCKRLVKMDQGNEIPPRTDAKITGYDLFSISSRFYEQMAAQLRVRNSDDQPYINDLFQQSATLVNPTNTITVTGENIYSISAVSSNPSVATVSVSGMNVTTTFLNPSLENQEVEVTVNASAAYGKTSQKTYKVNQNSRPGILWGVSSIRPKDCIWESLKYSAVSTSFTTGGRERWEKEYTYFLVPNSIADKVKVIFTDVVGSSVQLKPNVPTFIEGYTLYLKNTHTNYAGFTVEYDETADYPTAISLVDGQPYTLNESVENANITYTRTFANTDWQPLYVPFSMSYADWSRLGAVAELTGAGDGVLEWTTLEEGSQTVAGRPYIFKPNAAGTAAFVVNEATLVGCGTASPVAYGGYTLSGTYEEKSDMDRLYILSDGNFSKASADEALQPYRIYIEAPAGAPSQLRMRINGAEEAALQGDMDGDGKITMSDANIIVNMYLGGE